jgi:hypothetical protein
MTTATARADKPLGGPAQPGGKGQKWPFPPISLAPSSYGVEPTWTRRSTIADRRPERKPQSAFLRPCLDWLNSEDASRVVKKIARQYGLTVDVDDVLGQATMKIWRQLDASPDKQIDNVIGYCYRTVQRLVIDILRGQIGKKTVEEKAVAEIDWYRRAGIYRGEGSGEDLEHLDSFDRVQAQLEVSGAHPREVSAALSYITLVGHTDIECDDLPTPKAGAKPEHAQWWPSLWLATHDSSLFPGKGKGSVAQRKRLQRARERADEVLKSAHEAMKGGL